MGEKTQPLGNVTEPRNLRPQEMFDGESQRDTEPECRLRQDILALVVTLDDEPLFINVNVRRGITVTHLLDLVDDGELVAVAPVGATIRELNVIDLHPVLCAVADNDADTDKGAMLAILYHSSVSQSLFHFS